MTIAFQRFNVRLIVVLSDMGKDICSDILDKNDQLSGSKQVQLQIWKSF